MGTERTRELRRRRHRRKKVTKLLTKAEKANPSEKSVIVEKLRKLTPGADVIVANNGLEG
jgi:U3 small nucleolar ribonucleoprotein component